MVPVSNKYKRLNQVASEGMTSLFQQGGMVLLSFVAMLVITGGAPSGLAVGLTVGLSGLFVAWSEQRRLALGRSRVNNKVTEHSQSVVPEAIPLTAFERDISFERDGSAAPNYSENDLQAWLTQLEQEVLSPNKLAILRRKFAEYCSKINAVEELRSLTESLKASKDNFLELAMLADLNPRFDFGNANLSGANLSGADLSRADLSRADLSRADLSRPNLILANQGETNLSRANLWRANLIGANLSGAILIEANLNEANLNEANLIEANLSGAILIEANLSGANLSRAILIEANLNEANLSRANLWKANLSRAILIEANLSGADLGGADLGGAILIEANLGEAILIEANLSGADLSGTNLSEANVKYARFSSDCGISPELKQDLQARGAIFEDASGDRERVMSRR